MERQRELDKAIKLLSCAIDVLQDLVGYERGESVFLDQSSEVSLLSPRLQVVDLDLARQKRKLRRLGFSGPPTG